MRSPYRFFGPLNDRRIALIERKHSGPGLLPQESRELEMLQVVIGAMVDFRHPAPEIPKSMRAVWRAFKRKQQVFK
jgi:hypothetical protein